MRSLHVASIAAAGLALATGALAQPPQAQRFLTEAMRGDNSEMMLGQMAAERGASPALRDYGRMLHDDHAKARDDVVRLATAMHVRATDAPMPEAVQERRKLERLNGRAFDREFARYMVNDHRKDIADFRKASRMPGPIGQLAQNTLPTLQKHLAVAERLSRG